MSVRLGFAGADDLEPVEDGLGVGAGPVHRQAGVPAGDDLAGGGVDRVGGDVLLDAAFVGGPVAGLVGGQCFGSGQDVFAGVGVAGGGLG